MPQAAQHRAVGIAVPIGERVVLAMDGHPLAWILARRQPEHGPEQHIHGRVDGQRPVRQGAVEIRRRRDDGRSLPHRRTNASANRAGGHRPRCVQLP